MKDGFLIERVHSARSSFFLTIALIGLLNVGNGCNLSVGPSRTVETFIRTVERGEVDRAATFFSSGFINNRGIGPLKEDLSRVASDVKEHGGIKSIKILKEDLVGQVAEVSVEITRGNGYVAVVRYKLIKEQGAWKIDSLTSDSMFQANEALHPETAVADVVNWAREAGVANIKSWSEKQPVPAICKAPPIDRNTLPDEIKYHEVDDAKTRERLLNAFDPVLKLIACSNKEGVVLYKGLNVYAGSLDGGQIAITPGGLYFAAPDESIFHELAKLRIFLAREIFRQIVPVEKPS